MMYKTRKHRGGRIACPKGKILRKAYTRKAYTKKDGTRVAKSKVPASCVKDTGKKGKGPELIGKLKQGDLTKHGYKLDKTELARHRAIHKAVKEYGKNSVIRKLNALSILMRNTQPNNSKKLRKDMEYVQKTF